MNSRQLDDLIALLDAKSLTEAANRRHVTQPAFSRRIQAIEETLGFGILDRTKKPARLNRIIFERQDDIRTLALSLSRLVNELKSASASASEHVLRICTIHAISVSVLPHAIRRIERSVPSATVRLRTGNRDESFALLMTGQASIMVAYETDRREMQIDEELVERVVLKTEGLIPVIHCDREPEVKALLERNEQIPAVIYPGTSFMGQVLEDLTSYQRQGFSVRAISSLSPAILEMAMCGLGVGWITESQARPVLGAGNLVSLKDVLPSVDMKLVMLRPRTSHPSFLEAGWEALRASLVI